MKLVFSDIDGTLLYHDKSLSEKNRYAIQQLHKQGDIFVIVTGRSPLALQSLLEEIDFVPDCIYCSGTYMECNGKPVFSTGFSFEQAKEIEDYLEQAKLSYSIYSEKIWISPRRDAHLELEERLVKAKSAIGTLNDIPNNAPITKFLVMSTPDAVQDIQKKLKVRFPDYDMASGMDYLIDITKGDMNKGTACKQYCELYGYDIADAVCFGDGQNDVEMLRAVGHPYVMANASEALKAEFPNHALSNEEDGVYHKLLDLGWIPPYPEK